MANNAIKSFIGSTTEEAYKQAVKAEGPGISVISTKQLSTAGPNTRELYEVRVMSSENKTPYINPNITNRNKFDTYLQNSSNFRDDDYIQDTKLPTIKRAVKEQYIIPKRQTQNKNKTSQENSSNNQISNNQIGNDDMKFLRDELMKLNKTVSVMKKNIWENNKKSSLHDLMIPPEFEEIYDIFIKNELKEEMSYKILRRAIEKIPLHLRLDINKTKELFKHLLQKIIVVKKEELISTNQRKIIMFVGPTGVGKTTTIAKLAARYLYQTESKYKVGVITLDLFRVGAVEQLNSYAKIMKIPIESAKTSDEFKKALHNLSHCNYILVDTAGASQYDIEKIELVNKYLQSNLDISIERSLVMPLNIKNSDLEEIYKKFSKLFIHNLIFSKLDETNSFGSLISFANIVKKPMTYLSIGQNVPDDLIVADKNFIIDAFMNMRIK